MWYNLDTNTTTPRLATHVDTYICKILKIYSSDLYKITEYVKSLGYHENDISRNNFNYIEIKQSSIPPSVPDIKEVKDMYYGYFTRSKVIRVVDGSTIVLAICITIDILKKLGSILPYGSGNNGGYTTSITCKLIGIEPKEKDRETAMKAKEYLERICNDLNMYVYVLFGEQEKYGRYLVQLFNNQKESINDIMLESKLCKPYKTIAS